jgi:hypothetical protein
MQEVMIGAINMLDEGGGRPNTVNSTSRANLVEEGDGHSEAWTSKINSQPCLKVDTQFTPRETFLGVPPTRAGSKDLHVAFFDASVTSSAHPRAG